ncbi:bifunctional phosphopantothenoylcysteine decarboxylase/phosphopantothenate--cysteine ligase CoaBC [Lacticaseibacillus porcinae]|uniref:bifunctional phosphopantothenoylcysteine decarboxylase/phosphopantothenate--cysteine ligase CoaBC n=1 Tax=Lacticaseibacillus porcinae TaxID=1123687 RepID=UPI000F7B128A|nr:bifunctional phosphopantothenoylcysteine decarboxylase/phosphopantothenate--cysteine ligase CoaBC [Lacticaseibacillus porcinae]
MLHKHIGVFVTGGIAAYKVPNLIRMLIKAGHEVQVAMTPAAGAFVTSQTLATVSKHPVLTDEHEFDDPSHVAHVAFAHWMDMALIVPATANTIAKLASGFADNVVTNALLAFNGPKLVVPAMNDQMWLNAQTQANIAHLKSLGMAVLPPATGFLAEGYQAVGRMPEEAVIALFVDTYQPQPTLQGKQVVITAGGTKERIDPVRYIGNDSSGKMGTALANIAAAMGADVELITTANLPTLPQVHVSAVQSASEMQQAVALNFDASDVVIMAAAVADYHVATPSDHKLKKVSEESGLTLELAQNPDILKSIGTAKTHQLVVGFAAETDELLTHAQAKLAKKHADLLVANLVGHGHGFNQDTNAVWLLQPNHEPKQVPEASKLEIAEQILNTIQQKMG